MTKRKIARFAQLFLKGFMSYLRYLFCLRIVMYNTYCVVFLFCLSSSCVPYVASFSGLSIFYYPFGILKRLLSKLRVEGNIITFKHQRYR
jgi:hypothetical protein